MTTPNDVREIVATNGGQMTGNTRLQKTAYFLEVGGVGLGYDFSYHYYGPYSEELATDATDAIALGLISRAWETSKGGFQYATYHTLLPPSETNAARIRRRQEILSILENYDAVALELAATAHFLAVNGFQGDPWTETRRRKAGKATGERVERAKQLLDQLGFAALG